MSFDNLTIRRKNGVVRAVKEYYPYGLEFGRYNGNFAYNAEAIYDQGYGGSSWQDKEWFTPSGSSPGLDLNYFEARYYDPILGRWHAPDPLEQCHSPYLALLDDPANHIDPDGRSAWASLCGTAAHGAQSFTTVMNVSSAFSQTFGAFGGVMQFVTSSASIAGGLRMVKNLLDFVNGGAEFSEVAGNWIHDNATVENSSLRTELHSPEPKNKGRRYSQAKSPSVGDANQIIHAYQRRFAYKLNTDRVKDIGTFRESLQSSLGKSTYKDWFGNSNSNNAKAIKIFYELIRLGNSISEFQKKNYNSSGILVSSTSELGLSCNDSQESNSLYFELTKLEQDYWKQLDIAYKKHYYGGFSKDLIDSYDEEFRRKQHEYASCAAKNEVGWMSPMQILKVTIKASKGSGVFRLVEDSGFIAQPVLNAK